MAGGGLPKGTSLVPENSVDPMKCFIYTHYIVMTYNYPTGIHQRLHPGLLSRRPSGGKLQIDEVLL